MVTTRPMGDVRGWGGRGQLGLEDLLGHLGVCLRNHILSLCAAGSAVVSSPFWFGLENFKLTKLSEYCNLLCLVLHALLFPVGLSSLAVAV